MKPVSTPSLQRYSDDNAHLRSSRCRCRCGGRQRRRARAGAGRRRARPRRGDRQDRVARALLAGADDRGHDAPGPGRVRSGEHPRRHVAGRRPRLRLPASPAARPRRQHSLAEAADALDLRALWRGRSPLAGRLSQARGLQGPRARSNADLRRYPRRHHGIRIARPGRRRLSNRHQVEDGDPRERRSQIHRLQCGRGRQRHFRRPDDHGRRPLRGDRRHDHRWPHCRRH